MTPLYLACKHGFCEIVKYFIDNGANINSKDHDGKTPLHIACFSGKTFEIVKLLVTSGVTVKSYSYSY